MKRNHWFLLLIVILMTAACNKDESSLNVHKTFFGKLENGNQVFLYTLKNDNGMEVKITNYGGIVTSIKVPDKDGQFGEVTLGYESLKDYLTDSPYFGAIIGRYGNRIANGKFSIEDENYQLPLNDGPNSLHGGDKGFDKVLWKAKINGGEEPYLDLSYLSPDGEMGYPGNLEVKVRYTLLKDNSLKIEYDATTDKATVINLTNHTYFNLAGRNGGDILGHQLKLNADRFLAVNENLIPEGEPNDVAGTPFDFSELKTIGKQINDKNQQLVNGKGYDHCWVLTDQSPQLKLVAEVSEPSSGRKMEVYTTEPGIQFYSGNFLDGKYTGQKGENYPYRTGFCLETQHYPDSPNRPDFPSTLLKPGEQYKSTTVYKFKLNPEN